MSHTSGNLACEVETSQAIGGKIEHSQLSQPLQIKLGTSLKPVAGKATVLETYKNSTLLHSSTFHKYRQTMESIHMLRGFKNRPHCSKTQQSTSLTN